MKLKNLAALLFRMLGAMFMIEGFGDVIATTTDFSGLERIIEPLAILSISYLLIKFSKQLAELFCRGLDDGSV